MLSNLAKFTADADLYVPVKKDAVWQLKAKPISGVPEMANLQPHNLVKMGVAPTVLQLGGRTTVQVSAGIHLLPLSNYKLVWTTDPEFAKKGGLVLNTGHITSGEVSFSITNVGKNIVAISPGDVVAIAWLEPIYPFELERVV